MLINYIHCFIYLNGELLIMNELKMVYYNNLKFNFIIKDIFVLFSLLLISPFFSHAYLPVSNDLTYSDIIVLFFFLINFFFYFKYFIRYDSLLISLIIIILGFILYNSYQNYNSLLKSMVQSIIVIILLINNFKYFNVSVSNRNKLYIFILINLMAIFQISLFGNESYAAFNTLPFFDSVDKGFFFILLLSFLIQNKKIFNFFNYNILIFLSSINILFSGSRTSLLILIIFITYFLIINIKKSKIFFLILIFFVFIWINQYSFIKSILLDPSIVGSKQVMIFDLIYKINFLEFFYFIINDNSFLVRIENTKIIWDNFSILNFFIGFGSESWKSILDLNQNSSLDNSLIVLFFNYGLIGILFYFYILNNIYKNLGFYFTINIFLFSMIQDIFGNFMFVSNILFFLILSTKNSLNEIK